MWPLKTGSIQPLKHLPVELRPKSPSAPQLTPAVEKFVDPRWSFLPEPRDTRRPGPYFHRLFSQDQLSTLGSLPADEAMSTMISCLPAGVPTLHAPTLSALLYSVLRWAARTHMDGDKTSLLLTVYWETYRFCVESPWRTQAQLYAFFKESLLRSSVRHSPRSERVLAPEQCRASLLQFCRCYLTTLPLVRLVSLPNYRLQLTWDQPAHEQLLQSNLL